MKNETAIIIFSVHRDNLPGELNYKNHAKALQILEKNSVVYSTGTGCYKGDEERCIMVVCYEQSDATVARYLASRYNQESVLCADSARVARLETPDGELIARLGHLVAVPRSQAVKLDAWTRINGQYWITRKTSDAENRAAYEHALIEFAKATLAALDSPDDTLDKIVDLREIYLLHVDGIG